MRKWKSEWWLFIDGDRGQNVGNVDSSWGLGYWPLTSYLPRVMLITCSGSMKIINKYVCTGCSYFQLGLIRIMHAWPPPNKQLSIDPHHYLSLFFFNSVFVEHSLDIYMPTTQLTFNSNIIHSTQSPKLSGCLWFAYLDQTYDLLTSQKFKSWLTHVEII